MDRETATSPGLVLGVDLSSTCTGFALVDLGTLDLRGLGHVKPIGAWEISRRVHYVMAALAASVASTDVVDIWAEGIGTRMVAAAASAGRCHQAFAATVIEFSPLDRRIDHAYGTVSPAELKRHATGKGNADKAMMLAAARRQWPHVTFCNDDEADAAWVAHYGATRIAASMAAPAA